MLKTKIGLIIICNEFNSKGKKIVMKVGESNASMVIVENIK